MKWGIVITISDSSSFYNKLIKFDIIMDSLILDVSLCIVKVNISSIFTEIKTLY